MAADGRGEDLDFRAIVAAVRRRARLIAIAGAVAGVATGVWFAARPAVYRATVVVVPVGGQRASVTLPGVASFLGGSVQLGSSGFEATQDVVAYLLRSRTVLMTAAARSHGGGPVGALFTGAPLDAANEEENVRALRREVRVTQSKETGFVTVMMEGADSGAVRLFLSSVVEESQRLFSAVARAQARQLLAAQDRRLDSAMVDLRTAEGRLMAFDDANRAVPARSRLAMERSRLERAVNEANQVHQLVQADRQAAVARGLEDAPALALVEPLPAVLAPKAQRPLFRAVLVGLGVAAGLLLLVVASELVRSPAVVSDR